VHDSLEGQDEDIYLKGEQITTLMNNASKTHKIGNAGTYTAITITALWMPLQ